MAHTILTENVNHANGRIRGMLGVGFRRSLPEDYALVFDYENAKDRWVHTLWCPFNLRVIWTHDGVVTRNDIVPPFRMRHAWGDTVIETHPSIGQHLGFRDKVLVDKDEIRHEAR